MFLFVSRIQFNQYGYVSHGTSLTLYIPIGPATGTDTVFVITVFTKPELVELS